MSPDPFDLSENTAIRLLAKAIEYFGNAGALESIPPVGLSAGQPFDFSTWNSLDRVQQELVAYIFAGAKDEISGQLTARARSGEGGHLAGDTAFRFIMERHLLD
jgi:hypothetical protein